MKHALLRCSCALALLVSTATASPQEFLDLGEWGSTAIWDPAELGPLDHVHIRAAGQFDDDPRTDLALTAAGRAAVALGAGAWELPLHLYASGVRDLCALTGGRPGGDALLVATDEGLELLRWTDATEDAFSAVPVPGPWSSTDGVRAMRSGAPGTPHALVYVLDQTTTLLHPVRIDLPVVGEPTLLHSPPILLTETPLAIELLEFNGLGEPEVAVARPGGVDVYSVTGQQLAGAVQPQLAAGLVRFQPGSFGRDRLAWIAEETGGGPVRLRVLDLAGLEPPLALDGLAARGIARGELDGDGLDDLALSLANSGAGTVLVQGCGNGGSFSADAECRVEIGFGGGARSAPALVDLDADGDDDLALALDDAAGFVRWDRDSAPGGRLWLEGVTTPGSLYAGAPYVVLDLHRLMFGQAVVTRVELALWRWPTLEGPLENEVVGYAETAFTSESRDLVVPLRSMGSEPTYLALDIRGYDEQDELASSVAYGLTESCPAYAALLASAPDGSPAAPPEDCPQVPPGVGGEYVGGFVKLPKLRGWEDPGDVPELPPLDWPWTQ